MSTELPDHAEVIVIGGGIMGCSTLYHLAAQGVEAPLLLERDKLTSGTTWHSAAQVRQLRSTRNLTRLIQYSAQLYSSLEAETGQSTGWLQTGSLSIASNADRWTHVRRQAALARAYGVETHELTAAEAGEMWPLMRSDDLVGAVYAPGDGRVNPSDLCLALSKGARSRGARVLEDTSVTGFLLREGRIAGVRTSRGEVRSEKVVLCGGLWSRGLALEAGANVPLLPCEHFYLLTLPMEGLDPRPPTLSDHDGHLYIREEVGGLLVGCFEPGARPLDPAGLGEDFAFGLLNEDWDHFEPMMRNALHRIPALEHAEARMLLNGPESFTPDSNFLLGESVEVPGLFLGCGMNSVGIATGGGAGWALAHWVVHGAPEFELAEADPARFHASQNRLEGLMARAPEVLGRHYEIGYPGRQWHSDRDLRRLPLHDQHVADGARFAQVFGIERPQYFGASAEPELTYARPPWFEQVGREVHAAHTGCAVFDLSSFGVLRVHGADAASLLARVCSNRMDRAPGRAIYTAMLNQRGGFVSDLTALRISREDYLLYVGTAAVNRDRAWLLKHREASEEVAVEDLTEAVATLAVCGPRTSDVLRELGAEALADLGYFRHAESTVADIPVRGARISYTGESGLELSCDAARTPELYRALREAGAVPAGLFAQTSMRIEKRYLSMGHDLDGDLTPIEAGLDFAVRDGGGFLGAEAVAAARESGPRRRMVSIVLEDADAVPLGDEPLYRDGELVGQATSAAFGYRVGRPVVLAYVASGILGSDGTAPVSLDLAGERVPGTASLQAAFDAPGRRLRG